MVPLPPSDSGVPSDVGAFDPKLLALRERLRAAREERGSCPPWDELRADLLPGGGSRPGRDERLAHSEICPYCDAHLREWRKSFDHTADALEAVERGVLRGITGGAKRLFGSLARARSARAARAEAAAESAPYEPPPPPRQREERRALSAREERELEARAAATPEPAPVRMYEPPPPPRPRPAARASADVPVGDAGILVVEIPGDRTPPEAVFLCAQVLGLEVAILDALEELEGDPDLGAVRGVILAGQRAPETWPDAVRRARALVGNRPVVLMAPFGVTPSAGAKRALGSALIAESDPAERLLLLLDPQLR